MPPEAGHQHHRLPLPPTPPEAMVTTGAVAAVKDVAITARTLEVITQTIITGLDHPTLVTPKEGGPPAEGDHTTTPKVTSTPNHVPKLEAGAVAEGEHTPPTPDL